MKLSLTAAAVLALTASAWAATPASTAPATAAAPAAVAALTSAAAWTQTANSTLSFATSYDGEEFSGGFKQFTADLRFDPQNLPGSRFDVVIQLASANTENEERDETLLGSEFFNAVAAPQARYTATRFRKLADGRFVADGTLSLRGLSKVVPLTFTWTPGAAPTLVGSAVVNRLDFNVGTGDWDDVEVMPNAVKVETRLSLRPKG